MTRLVLLEEVCEAYPPSEACHLRACRRFDILGIKNGTVNADFIGSGLCRFEPLCLKSIGHRLVSSRITEWLGYDL